MDFLNRKKKTVKPAVEEVQDFSTAMIKKAVQSEIAQNPVTVFSGVGVLASAFYMGLISVTPLAFTAFLISSALCTGSYVINKFFREGHIEEHHIKKMLEALNRQREKAIRQLQQDLKRFDCIEGFKQIDLVKDSYDSLVSVINRKISTEGLTYSRVVGMAEQIYKNVLDNLQQVVACLDSISIIDPQKISKQLVELKRKTTRESSSIKKNINNLESTLKMREERLKEIEELLQQNISAMNQLDQFAMDVAKMATSKDKQATTDLELLIEDFVRLRKTLSSSNSSTEMQV